MKERWSRDDDVVRDTDTGILSGKADYLDAKELTYVRSSDGTYYIVAGIDSCTAVTKVVIADTYNNLPVKIISDYAFAWCGALTSITIPNSIMSIGANAFIGCGLTSITIPNSVINIGGYTFEGCYNLKHVTIGNSVRSIGIRAFYGCSGLTSVMIPNSVKSIWGGAFVGCSGLTSIQFQGTKAQWQEIEKDEGWNSSAGDFTVQCADGKLDKNGNEIE